MEQLFKTAEVYAGKILLLAVAALFSLPCLSQQVGGDWRSRIDDIIEQTDSLSLKSQTTFYLTRYLKDDQTIKETWYYTLKDGKPVFFQLRYMIDSSEYTETYYLNRNRLICMARFQEPYSPKSNEQDRTEIFFFLDNTLRQYVTSGSQKQYVSKFNRQMECLGKFEQRFNELRANLRWKE